MTGAGDGYAIRRATPADAGVLARLAAATFTETFGHLYPREDLDAFLALAYPESRQATLLADPAQAAWLLERDGEAVGHAAAGPCTLPHPDVAHGDGELKRLYVLRTHQGGGRGTRLCRVALDWLLADGARTLWIGVWSENLGAQRLYARHGFEHVGEYEFPVGRVRDREFILRRPADA
ncbi:N-acetyltransferase [Luteimonas pelagia]